MVKKRVLKMSRDLARVAAQYYQKQLDELLERFEEFKRNAAAQIASLEHQMQERQQTDYAVNQALINGSKRLQAERNADREEVAMLTKEIDELRASYAAVVAERRDARAERDAANEDVLRLRDDLATLTQANAEADAIILQMRKDWSGDVAAAREIVERKLNEIVELRRVNAELRAEVAALQAQQEHASQWGTLSQTTT